MANISYIHTNFTAGELSPRLLGRVDIQKYPNSAETIYNAYPLIHGGARRRPGSRFRAETKDSSKRSRLIPFTFSRTQSFILEVGHLYIRFFTPTGQILSGGLPYEISSPYTESDLDELHFAQQEDTMLFTHTSYPEYALVRRSNTDWQIKINSFTPPPSDELGEDPAGSFSASATSGSITASTSVASFIDADVGRLVRVGQGLISITTYTNSTSISAFVNDTLSGAGPFPADQWTILGSPRSKLTPNIASPEGAAVQITADIPTFKSTSSGYSVDHRGSLVYINGGIIQITGFTSNTIVTGIILKKLDSVTDAPAGSWQMVTAIWNADKGYPRAVGLFAQRQFLGGSPSFPNRLSASKIGERFNFTEGLDDDDGFTYGIDGDYNAIEHIVPSNTLIILTSGGGYSLAGGVERPITPSNPQLKKETSYGSSNVRPVVVGDEVLYVQRGYKKIRAMGYTIQKEGYTSEDISIISEHLTKRGIYEMSTSTEPDSLVWMVRGDGALVTMAIDRSQSVVGLSRNFTKGVFESIATIPNDDLDQTAVIVKRKINGNWKRYVEVFEDGLNTDSCISGNVSFIDIVSISWSAGVVTVEHSAHAFTTGDEVKIVNVVGFLVNDDADEIETDTFNGIVQITVVDGTHFTYTLADDPGEAIQLGSVLYGKTTTWGGLTHLIGQEVDIVADGVVENSAIVDNSGNVSLGEAAYQVEIGLHYKTRIKLLTPAVNSPTGTAQGSAMSTYDVRVRLYKSIGGKINGKPIPFRKFGSNVLNKPLVPFTGDVSASQMGWSQGTDTVLIEQDQPLPLQVLAVIRKMTINA